MNQKQRVERYINQFGSITPLEAIYDLGITKLATVVSTMKKDGYVFYQKLEKSQNRWGEPTTYMKYAFSQTNLERKTKKNINILKFFKTLKKGI